MVRIALLVCSVPSTRWPVSAAVSASEMVSRSRSSPMRDDVRVLAQRGAQRAGEGARCGGSTWRWLTTQRFETCRYSIGSSIVMMWSARSSLIMLTSAARVEDLPQPAGPVTSTIPWW